MTTGERCDVDRPVNGELWLHAQPPLQYSLPALKRGLCQKRVGLGRTHTCPGEAMGHRLTWEKIIMGKLHTIIAGMPLFQLLKINVQMLNYHSWNKCISRDRILRPPYRTLFPSWPHFENQWIRKYNGSDKTLSFNGLSLCILLRSNLALTHTKPHQANRFGAVVRIV